MAKTCMIEREKRRRKLAARYAAQRAALKKLIADPAAGYEEKTAAINKLNQLPRNSSPSRQRNRCALTGRSRGYYRKFGLSRTALREATMRGDVPGLRKGSW